MESFLEGKRVLITGGTSGLGKSLAIKLFSHGCHVTTVARSAESFEIAGSRYQHYACDFSDFSTVKKLILELSATNTSIDLLINNAGILSPPHYIQTVDGFEFSYQVNFLAHLYLTRALTSSGILKPECVVNISSPIHTKGRLDFLETSDAESYKLLQAYANTKLYLALFSQQLSDQGSDSFSFDPGTFSSGIYRQQKKWFHFMYKIAAPFMVSSEKVAQGLFKIIESRAWTNGMMINRHGKLAKLLKCKPEEVNQFWKQVDKQLVQVGNT